jgi:hypothetical protein
MMKGKFVLVACVFVEKKKKERETERLIDY